MGYAVDVIVIIALFALFGIVHSFMASNKIKRVIIDKYGNLIAFYRLFYTTGSLVFFYLIYQSLPKPRPVIYDLPKPYDMVILIPQFLSLLGAVWTFKYFSLQEFLGTSQVFRWLDKEYDIYELDEKLTLRIEGPYKFSRHPLYLFSILFLCFRPEMDLFYLTALFCIIAYFYIGSVYEERKLVEKFGQVYSEYQKNVPRIFPLKINIFNSELK